MSKDVFYYPLRRHLRLSEKNHQLTTPFLETFELAHFSYFSVDEEGDSICLCTNHEWMELYLYEELFVDNLFLKNPRAIPAGAYFTRSFGNGKYRQKRTHAQKFGIQNSLAVISKERGRIKGFSLGMKRSNELILVNELPLLKKFCHVFQKENQQSIAELEANPINLLSYLGDSFHTLTEELALDAKKRSRLLSQLGVKDPKLTPREKECLQLLLQGETAKSTAATLKLSTRTVEYYFDNIKNKLNCFSKIELIKKSRELASLNLLSSD